jgi:hypothetical protein
VAGRFYPDDPRDLEATVRACIGAGSRGDSAPPVALVAPHAGYVYSGPVAGSAYSLLVPRCAEVRRVVIVGPSHHVAFRGLALPESAAFDTPLGEHPVDPDGAAALEAHPLVRRWERAHAEEHSLEVQLPFLRVVLGAVPVLPLVTGETEPGDVADALERVWDAGTLVVVSSDLSHYLPYERARAADHRTASAVERLDGAALGPHDACGVVGLRGLLEAARRRGLTARCVDLRNSGDTEGSRSRVVGYGAFGFWAS